MLYVMSIYPYNVITFGSVSLLCGRREESYRENMRALASRYLQLVGEHKPFEVVFISCDQDASSASECFRDMPWLMLPHADRAACGVLSRFIAVDELPALVLLDRTNGVVTKNGFDAVMTTTDFDNIATYEATVISSILALPASVLTTHHTHLLMKTPSVPSGYYCCDVCGGGGQGWLFHCSVCRYEAHPKCVFDMDRV